MATVSTLLDKKDYARANGLRSLAFDGTQIGGPILGGLLLALIFMYFANIWFGMSI